MLILIELHKSSINCHSHMEEQIAIIKQTIEKRLLPLVDRDYVFIDLPYHPNVGDILIAFAAKNILRESPYRCLYSSSGYSFDNRTMEAAILVIYGKTILPLETKSL